MVARQITHPGLDERGAAGQQPRAQTAPPGHAGWRPDLGRPDLVVPLMAQNLTRELDLVPKLADQR
jgi:hypothetical protein